MNKYVLDSSALLAVVYDERGANRVESIFSRAVLSAVNLAECLARMSLKGIPVADAHRILTDMVPAIIPFDQEIALIAGQLARRTQSLGLSLGDRACLATAAHLQLEAVTADKVWAKIKGPMKIMVIR